MRVFSLKSPSKIVSFIGAFLIVVSLMSNTYAQGFESIIQQALKYELALNEKAALLKFIEAQKMQPLNLDVLYKCSDLCGRIGNREKKSDSRNDYFASSMAYAKIAIKQYPNSDVSNVAMAIVLGHIALAKSPKEKISIVIDIKKYAEKAIRYNSSNAIAWHILGKWYYEVSDLNFFEKMALKIMYSDLPNASFGDAIKYFEKARSVDKDFMLNYFELAKSYLKNNQKSKAKIVLSEVLKLGYKTEDDILIKKEADKLLNSLN